MKDVWQLTDGNVTFISYTEPVKNGLLWNCTDVDSEPYNVADWTNRYTVIPPDPPEEPAPPGP